MRKVAEALKALIPLEREAYGMETAGGGSGKDLPTVTMRDLTGRK